MYSRYSNSVGFTLIEIIAIFAMLSVISLIFMSFNLSDSIEPCKEVDIAKSHLRYVRSLALSNDSISWGIRFSTNSYELQKAGSATTFPLPGEISSTHKLPPGIIISPVTITFDQKGSVSSSDTKVQFSGGNEITIIKSTGFIP